MTLRHAPRLFQPRANRLTVAPTVEPVTAMELRAHLRIEGTSEDSALLDLIAEARGWLEDQFGIAFTSQSWKVTFDRWPVGREDWWDGMRDGAIGHIGRSGGGAAIELPRWPLIGITSVTTYDEDSDSTVVVVATTFDIDTQSKRGRLSLRSGQTWPSATRPVNAIEIIYTAGFGTAASDVPAPLKRAIRELAAHLYTHRGDCDAQAELSAARIMSTYADKRI